MSKIYSDSHEELHKLLVRASSENGATLLIPDLQRPYVWSPSQVVLLLDSLIRGWPFGTLLLWDVHEDDLSRIPSRPFWRLVDRTGEGGGTKVTQQNPPATFHMVLDGQQRVQSLVLALGGDSWGFKLLDRDWHAELGTRQPKGRSAHQHWSVGTLCVDLDALVSQFHVDLGISGVDFTRVLKWVVTDTAAGKSPDPRGGKYVEPLPDNGSAAVRGSYIRLSRLWEKAPAKEGIEPELYERLLKPVLDEHAVTASRSLGVMRSLTSLAQSFSRIKLTRVTYLKVERFDPSLQTEDSYNDSVVGIFTRLNTAGRTLTREEITFAWLKVGWDRALTRGMGANECFEQLLNDLQQEGLGETLSLDDVVAATSFAWAVDRRGGSLISDRDLLKKDIIQPMAGDLSSTWAIVVSAFCRVAGLLKERKVEYRSHYQSLNALWILCAWRLIGERHEANFQKATAPQRSDFIRSLDSTLERFVDRWFFCSSWAGRWGRASGQIMAGYAARLAELKSTIERDAATLEDAAAWLELFLEDEVRNFVAEATADIERLGAEQREQVRNYYSYLWIWHRIDASRWDVSSVALREHSKKKTSIDVDHVVPVAMWNKLSVGDSATETNDPGEWSENGVHNLGNSVLLEKSFNISKGDRPLESLLMQLKEFKDGTRKIDSWGEALLLSPLQISVTDTSRSQLWTVFQARESRMKADLIAFVKGERLRQDV